VNGNPVGIEPFLERLEGSYNHPEQWQKKKKRKQDQKQVKADLTQFGFTDLNICFLHVGGGL
jgi:hypothetical protein